MDCTRFERTLDLLLSRTAPPAVRAAAELHLRTCDRCRRLYGPAVGDESETPQASDLTRSILETTTGPACHAAAQALGDAFDQEPDHARTRLLELHCSACADCGDLAAVMQMLRRVLPHMAARDPGIDFTAGVVAATRRLPGPRPRSSTKSRGQLWQRLVSRPLFAWEAAYAGTLLFALIFLNPVLPVATPSLRTLAAVHESAAARVLPAETAVIEFAHTVADGVAGCGSSVGETLGSWTGRAEAFLHGTARDLRGRLRLRQVPRRTFLPPMRLPGCEVSKTDEDNRGDHV